MMQVRASCPAGITDSSVPAAAYSVLHLGAAVASGALSGMGSR